MICRNCGNEIKEDEAVCPSCGAPVDSSDDGERLISFDGLFLPIDGVDTPSHGPESSHSGEIELDLFVSDGFDTNALDGASSIGDEEFQDFYSFFGEGDLFVEIGGLSEPSSENVVSDAAFELEGPDEPSFDEDAQETRKPSNIEIFDVDLESIEDVPEEDVPEEDVPEVVISDETFPEEELHEDEVSEEELLEEEFPEEEFPEEETADEETAEEELPQEALLEEELANEALPDEALIKEKTPDEAVPEEASHEEELPEEELPEEAIHEEASIAMAEDDLDDRCEGAEAEEGALESSAIIPGSGAPKHAPSSQESKSKVSDKHDDKDKGRKRAKIRILVIAAIIATIAVVLGVCWIDLHSKTAIAIETSFSETDIGETSGMPIKIQGKDLDGNAIDQNMLVVTEGQPLELLRGDYKITVQGNPVERNGQVYTRPLVEYPLSIEADGVEIDGGFYQNADGASLKISLQTVSPDSVDEGKLAEINAWMEEYGFPSQEIDDYIKAILDFRNQTIAAAAETEKKRQEELARSKAEAAQRAAFKSFPAKFSFSNKSRGKTDITIKRDGTFSGQWRQASTNQKGSNYPKGTVRICSFAGTFSVLAQNGKTSFRLQLDDVHARGKASRRVKNGIRYIYVTNNPYGLGKMTKTAVKGWTLYLRGTKSSVLSSREKSQVAAKGSTLKTMVLANGRYAWTGKAVK